MHFSKTQPCIMASFALWTKDSVDIKSTFKYFLRVTLSKFKCGAKRALRLDWR